MNPINRRCLESSKPRWQRQTSWEEQIHGGFDLNAAGNNSKNYHAHGEVGAGTVVWRSENKNHSVGVGAHAEQHRGKFQGHGIYYDI
ncbi:hypothetical protein Anas_13272 [Armadillidium nasatum]|uniref:Uncharacterized protein n=1 Tax=Armadillidium nasatum TaxID=96803 RepID=A0A5N5SMM7_9CRUS|nr:hypothetical protein Anas_13272 [Armadillidium nasatum]